MSAKTRHLLSWLFSGLLALGFVGAGASKLAGAAEQPQNLHNCGYPEWLRYPIGAAEILLALYGVFAWAVVAPTYKPARPISWAARWPSRCSPWLTCWCGKKPSATRPQA